MLAAVVLWLLLLLVLWCDHRQCPSGQCVPVPLLTPDWRLCTVQSLPTIYNCSHDNHLLHLRLIHKRFWLVCRGCQVDQRFSETSHQDTGYQCLCLLFFWEKQLLMLFCWTFACLLASSSLNLSLFTRRQIVFNWWFNMGSNFLNEWKWKFRRVDNSVARSPKKLFLITRTDLLIFCRWE